ncbi:MAG: alpha/beta fold hydrolase [Arenibacterium sp.]
MSVPLVLLPGLMCDSTIFAPQFALLSKECPVTIAPVTLESRIETMASALLTQLPPRFALVGYDFGGHVAMELMRRAPERIDRICLMSTTPLADTPGEAAAREPWIVKAQANRLDDVLEEVFASENYAACTERGTLVTRLRDMARGLGAEVFVRQMRALQRRHDYQGTLRRCRGPMLILCGAEDPLCPSRRQSFMAELVPSARLEVLDGAGHAPTLEQPNRVMEIWRDWLAAPLVLA